MVAVRAQETENPRHIFGVRAGVNFSRTFDTDMFDDFEHEFGVGFHLGGVMTSRFPRVVSGIFRQDSI